MTEPYTDNQTKTSKIHNNYLFTIFATMGGVMVGVFGSLAMTGPMLKSQVASATDDLAKTVSVRPANEWGAMCVEPDSSGESGSVAGAFTTTSVGGRGAGAVLAPAKTGQMPQGGKGAETPAPQTGSNKWVEKFVGGSWSKTEAAMNNTGPYSNNEINTTNKTTTTIKNTNDVNVVNKNEQTAVSGDATVKLNTNGGSATSGEAENESTTSTQIHISN